MGVGYKYSVYSTHSVLRKPIYGGSLEVFPYVYDHSAVLSISLALRTSETDSHMPPVLSVNPERRRCIPTYVFLPLGRQRRRTRSTRLGVWRRGQAFYVRHARGCSRSEEHEFDLSVLRSNHVRCGGVAHSWAGGGVCQGKCERGRERLESGL